MLGLSEGPGHVCSACELCMAWAQQTADGRHLYSFIDSTHARLAAVAKFSKYSILDKVLGRSTLIFRVTQISL